MGLMSGYLVSSSGAQIRRYIPCKGQKRPIFHGLGILDAAPQLIGAPKAQCVSCNRCRGIKILITGFAAFCAFTKDPDNSSITKVDEDITACHDLSSM